MGGDLSVNRWLDPGESWEFDFQLDAYVRPDRVGP